MDRKHLYGRTAGGLLVLAGIVLIVAPYLLDMPNPIGLAVGIVSVLIGLGVGAGRLWTVGVIWSAVWLFGASAIWAAIALSGFGLGTPWWDLFVEAVVLAALFGGALTALLLAGKRPTPRPTG